MLPRLDRAGDQSVAELRHATGHALFRKQRGITKLEGTTDSEWESTTTVVQEVRSPLIPEGAHVMTVLISHPPGAPGYPPHRLPGGPGFGYMIDGEMLFELEGEAPRVLRAGDAFWGAGGDVIHYQDANNRTDIPCSFVLTLFCLPGQPMLEWVTEEELEERKRLHVSISPSIDGHVDTSPLPRHTPAPAQRRQATNPDTHGHTNGVQPPAGWCCLEPPRWPPLTSRNRRARSRSP